MADDKEIKIHGETKIISRPSLVLREESDNWALLFDPDTGGSLGLNPVSVLIWKNLDGKNTINHLLSKVHESCIDVPGQVEEDVLKFIKDLLKRGLVTIVT